MKVSVLKQGDCLIASVPGAVDDAELRSLQQRLAEQAGHDGVRGVVIDLTVLDVVDSYATRLLSILAQTIKLRGAEPVIVGIQPAVAFSMAQLGLEFEGIHTALDLDQGLALVRNARER